MKLETKRLILRPFIEEDVEDFYEYARVKGVGELAGWLPHQSIEATKVILRQFIESEDENFAIVWKENLKVIGSISIHHKERETIIPYDVQRHIGYVLSKDYWGQGIMPEAVERILQYGFEEKGIDVFLIAHFVHNKQSQRVIEKTGFEFYQWDTYFAKYLDKEFLERKYFYTKEMYEKKR